MGTYNKITVGERFGSRVVIAIDPSGTKRRMKFRIKCDCGAEQVVGGTTFRNSPQCKECCKMGSRRKYGGRYIADVKLYHSWVAMRRRCRPDTGDGRNARWAGRGIRVCPEWETSFDVFEQWAMGHGYVPGLSIDRIDNDGDYEPGNCEWVTRSVNSQRCRAQYHFVPRGGSYRQICFYDESCYGDY